MSTVISGTGTPPDRSTPRESGASGESGRSAGSQLANASAGVDDGRSGAGSPGRSAHAPHLRRDDSSGVRSGTSADAQATAAGRAIGVADGEPRDRAAAVAWRWIAGSGLLFVAAAAILPFVGPAPLDLDRVWARQEPDWSILVQLRLSRTLLGLFGGAALALAGTLFQAMLRDALATPYTLGVSSGASLGAILAIAAGWHVVAGVPGVWAGALGGAACVLLLVVGAARKDRHLSAFGLLLTGVATHSVCSALILLVHGLSGMSQSFAISRWLIGSLDALDYPALAVFVAGVGTLSIVVIRQARRWNLLAVGEDWAATRGANVPRLLGVGYVAGSLLAAGTVALTGPIGFIGLVVPHLVRTRVSGDHRVLMPCAFFFGGLLLASCDAASRVILAPAEIPAGAMTAFIGGPYLVWLVRRRS